ncbi:MAG TPA: ATPase domain-containing protein [Anaerolineales bacterium]|nr:ATPase domain-containing protein [Anaerolineales bacterium]
MKEPANINLIRQEISLGYPLDLLLNRECKPYDFNSIKNRIRSKDHIKTLDPGKSGIRLPDDFSAGTGNIVIKGKPGTGKSTLAFQIAFACTQRYNNFSAAFFPMEEQVEHVVNKAKSFGWGPQLRPVRHLQNVSESPSAEELGLFLDQILRVPKESSILQMVSSGKGNRQLLDAKVNSGGDRPYCTCYMNPFDPQPKVLLPSLSPRSIQPADSRENKLFWERYRQLENFLEGAAWLRDNRDCNYPAPRLVCLDSLNTFGDRLLEREEIFRVFDLFKRHKIIGVFILEVYDEEQQGSVKNLHQNTIEYLADTVISLQATEDNGYYMRYLEIQKSRYYHQIYGQHPFRLKDYDPKKQADNQCPRQAYDIFPSLHYIVSSIASPDGEETQDKNKTQPEENSVVPNVQPHRDRGTIGVPEPTSIPSASLLPPEITQTPDHSKPKSSTGDPENEDKFDFGVRGIKMLLPVHLGRGSVITIEGPKATFKSTLADNFLLRGLYRGENVLLIELQDTLSFEAGHVRLNWGLLDAMNRPEDQNDRNLDELLTFHEKLVKVVPEKQHIHFEKPPKIRETEWEYTDNHRRLVELTFSKGMLMAEEFIQTVRDVFDTIKFLDKGNGIKRVVLDDVSRIGISYPFLRSSKTAGDLFLPSFVHLMRNYGVDLLMIGTPSGLKESDEAIERACGLADTVVTCRDCDIFGDRFVTVSGEGMVAGVGRDSGKREPIPGTIRIERQKYPNLPIQTPFLLDLQFLQGLVGFDTQNIHRPGLSLHLMQASAVTRQYNDEVEKLLQFALARPVPSSSERRHVVGQSADVSMIPFDTRLAEPMYSSLAVLRDAPIDRTVVCTLDEFLEKQPDDQVYLVDVNNGDQKDSNDSEEDYHPGVLGKKPHGRPYYANVLLMAYRKDLLDADQIDPEASLSWGSILATLQKHGQDFPKTGATPVHVLFDYADLSHETMSCFLTDAILSGLKQTADPVGQNVDSFGLAQLRDVMNGPKNKKFLDEVRAFRDLIQMRQPGYSGSLASLEERSIQFGHGETPIADLARWFHVPIKDLKKQIDENGSDQPLAIQIKCGLRPDAAVYLCWYTQLRELLNEYRELADKIGICALPGGGVRGDWYLGIVQGSVSLQLGKKVIDLLCNKTEDFKRFSRGIGLPMRKVFREGRFLAWPGADGIYLNKALDIHDGAIVRSGIPNYMTIRHALANTLEELLFSKDGDQLLDELLRQIEVF